MCCEAMILATMIVHLGTRITARKERPLRSKATRKTALIGHEMVWVGWVVVSWYSLQIRNCFVVQWLQQMVTSNVSFYETVEGPKAIDLPILSHRGH